MQARKTHVPGLLGALLISPAVRGEATFMCCWKEQLILVLGKLLRGPGGELKGAEQSSQLGTWDGCPGWSVVVQVGGL